MTPIPLSELFATPIEFQHINGDDGRLRVASDGMVVIESDTGHEWIEDDFLDGDALNALLSRHAEMLEAQFKERIERLERVAEALVELDSKEIRAAQDHDLSRIRSMAVTALEEKS